MASVTPPVTAPSAIATSWPTEWIAFAAGSSSSATVIGMSALPATVDTIATRPQRPTNANTSGARSDHHAHERAGDRRGGRDLAPDEHLQPRQPIDDRCRDSSAHDRRHEADAHQQRDLRDRRRRLVHPADEHGDHHPVAEEGDALAEREPAECGRPQRPLEPLRDHGREGAPHGSQRIRHLGGAASALPPTSR